MPAMIQLVLALTLAAGAGEGASSAPAPDVFNAHCRAVLGPALRPGAWGMVHLDADNRFNATLWPGLGQEVRGQWHSVCALPELRPGERRAYAVPFRPVPGAVGPVALLDERVRPGQGFGGQARRSCPELVGSEDARYVAVLGRLSLPAGAPAGFSANRTTETSELPGYPAAYEGLDVLVVGELDGVEPSAVQRQALKCWFRAGGKVFVTSAAARRELADVLFMTGGVLGDAGTWDEWKRLAGASDDDVLAWTGEGGSREPLVVRFRTGFGQGAFLWPAAWRPDETVAAWSAYQRLLESSRCAPAVPLRDRAIYENFPPLRRSLLGADSALRWALAAALLVSTAGAIFWRRGRPWRLATAAAAAALSAATLVMIFGAGPDGRTLSVRIDEFSPDGAGVRARELLYLEGVAPDWQPEVASARGALPSPVLSAWEDAGLFSSRLDLPAPGSTDGPVLSGVRPGGGGIFVGAGPLTGVAPVPVRPAGARALAGLKADACVAAIADCLSDADGRCRAQAESLAEWLWRDLGARGMLGDKTAVYVSRLDDEPPALVPSGRVQSARLARLGIFFSDGGGH